MTRKILTSNLSFEEQNYKIRNEIKEGEIYNLSFLNKNLEGLKSIKMKLKSMIFFITIKLK